MQDLNVALIQCPQEWEDKKANLLFYEQQLENLDPQTELVLLPEMFTTGFTMNTEHEEDYLNSNSLNWIKKQAAKYSTAIYTSLIIKENDQTYNRGVFVRPNGEVHSYDKIKCFGLAKEDQYYTPGEKTVIVEYKGWKFCLQICYDLRFPEISRCAVSETNAEPDYHAILYVANWPKKRINHWDALLPARAVENQAFVLAVNRVGLDGNQFEYNGHSMVIDPNGQKLNELIEQSKNIQVQLKAKTIKEIRSALPFLKDGVKRK